MTDFCTFFNRHFEILTSPTRNVQDQAFRLRYQVYCLEKGFESHVAFKDRRERDQFDTRSLHAVVKHRETDTAMATVRLVTRPAASTTERFPVEHDHPSLLERHGISECVLPRATTGEISRFAISKSHRRHVDKVVPMPGGGQARVVSAAHDWQVKGRRNPLVTCGLFVALMRMSAMNDITHWLAVMEPSLLRLLSRFGIEFTPIGGLIDYHGRRQPCYGRVECIRDRVQSAHFNLWELANKDVASSVRRRRPDSTALAYPQQLAG